MRNKSMHFCHKQKYTLFRRIIYLCRKFIVSQNLGFVKRIHKKLNFTKKQKSAIKTLFCKDDSRSKPKQAQNKGDEVNDNARGDENCQCQRQRACCGGVGGFVRVVCHDMFVPFCGLDTVTV